MEAASNNRSDNQSDQLNQRQLNQHQLNQRRQRLQSLVGQSGDHPSGWFEPLYSEAEGKAQHVPWAMLSPHPQLIDWLDRQELGCWAGQSAVVVGCGLGDDAEALANRGLCVTAFDISATAIAWCRQRFPGAAVNYVVADLFQLDPSWSHRFDLVFESRTVQALPLNVRFQVMAAIAHLLAPDGTLVLITQLRDAASNPDGPPWPISEPELEYFQHLGLYEVHRHEVTEGDRPLRRIRLEYRRSV